MCRAIIEPLKARIRAAEAAAGGAGTPRASAAGTKWRRLLASVLNQRSHKSLTPLMLACEHGHATVAAYLLREGADPLAADFVHSRTCLHYAAVGGHADCLRLLCSDATQVPCPEGARPLRDVIVSDLQVCAAPASWGRVGQLGGWRTIVGTVVGPGPRVSCRLGVAAGLFTVATKGRANPHVQVQACRFMDQRAFGGLTALHFAVVRAPPRASAASRPGLGAAGSLGRVCVVALPMFSWQPAELAALAACTASAGDG